MDTHPKASRPAAHWRRTMLVLAGVGGLVWVLAWVDVRQAWPWIEGLGPWAAVAFCMAYALGSAAMLPGTVLTLAAGAKWGPVEGLFYVVIGSNLVPNPGHSDWDDSRHAPGWPD